MPWILLRIWRTPELVPGASVCVCPTTPISVVIGGGYQMCYLQGMGWGGGGQINYKFTTQVIIGYETLILGIDFQYVFS